MSIERSCRTFHVGMNVCDATNSEEPYYFIIIRTASWNGQQPFVEVVPERFERCKDAFEWINERR